MGTVTDKLYYIQNTKELIREAINNKGGGLDENISFREYVNAINNLELATPNFPPSKIVSSKVKREEILIGQPVSLYFNYIMSELDPSWAENYVLDITINLSTELGAGILSDKTSNLPHIFFFELDEYGEISAGNPISCSTSNNRCWVFPISTTEVILLQNIVSDNNLITYKTIISKGPGGLNDITIGVPTIISTVSSIGYNQYSTEIIATDSTDLMILCYGYSDNTILKFYQNSTNSIINTKTINSIIFKIDQLNSTSYLASDENNLYLLDITNIIDEYEDVLNSVYLQFAIIISESKIIFAYQNTDGDIGYLKVVEIINKTFTSYPPLELIDCNFNNAFVSSNNNIIIIYEDSNSMSYQQCISINNDNTLQKKGLNFLVNNNLFHIKTFNELNTKRAIFVDTSSQNSYFIYDLSDEGLFLAAELNFENNVFIESSNFLNQIVCLSLESIDGSGQYIIMIDLSEIGVRLYQSGKYYYYGVALENGLVDETITIRTSPFETQISSKINNNIG